MTIDPQEPRPRNAPPSAKPPDRKAAVEDARKSVEDAAAVSGTLWLSYLFTLFYIGLTASFDAWSSARTRGVVQAPP